MSLVKSLGRIVAVEGNIGAPLNRAIISLTFDSHWHLLAFSFKGAGKTTLVQRLAHAATHVLHEPSVGVDKIANAF